MIDISPLNWHAAFGPSAGLCLSRARVYQLSVASTAACDFINTRRTQVIKSVLKIDCGMLLIVSVGQNWSMFGRRKTRQNITPNRSFAIYLRKLWGFGWPKDRHTSLRLSLETILKWRTQTIRPSVKFVYARFRTVIRDPTTVGLGFEAPLHGTLLLIAMLLKCQIPIVVHKVSEIVRYQREVRV